MGCGCGAYWKRALESCKNFLYPDEVEPMELPGSVTRLWANQHPQVEPIELPSSVARLWTNQHPQAWPSGQAATTSSSAAVSSTSTASPHLPNEVPTTTLRPNQVQGRGHPEFSMVMRQHPMYGHQADCHRRQILLRDRQMRLYAHMQPIMLVPPLHMHTIPTPYIHLHPRHAVCTSHHMAAHHAPSRQWPRMYHGQGFIVAHHNHHHHVNYQ